MKLFCQGASIFVLLIVLACPRVVCADPQLDGYSRWLAAFKVEALDSGISAATFEGAVAAFRPLPRIIDLDRSQPEFTQTTKSYMRSRVTPAQLRRGRTQLSTYPTWLGRIEKSYGVPRRYLLALWGVESNYGCLTGDIPVVQALLTLAYDGRRSAYFRRELLDALWILQAHPELKVRMRGSWAGAMGQCQFMPSSYRRFAVNADGGGIADIWDSVPDVLASTANYLRQAGWQSGQRWGRPVDLPQVFPAEKIGLDTSLSLRDWAELGVLCAGGRALPQAGLQASLIQPDGPGSQAYLVYANFRVLLRWNRSVAFGLAVAALADGLEL